MDQIWKQLADALLPVVINMLVIAVPVIFTALTALIVQGIRWLQAKIEKENPTVAEQIKAAAIMAVQISEQMNLSGALKLEDRKAYAVQYLQDWSDKKGIKVDAKALSDSIEAAVFTELTREKAWLPTATTTVTTTPANSDTTTTTVTNSDTAVVPEVG